MASELALDGTLRDPFWLRHPRVIEIVGAIVIVLAAGTSITIDLITGPTVVGAIVPPLISLGGSALAVRRPKIGLIVVALAPLVSSGLGHSPLVVWTIGVFAAFLLSLRGERSLFVGPVVAATSYLAFAWFESSWVSVTSLLAVSLSVTAAAVGAAARGRMQAIRVARQRLRERIAARGADANRRVAEERVRIARDLHDVIGHEVAVLSVHLSMVQVALPQDATDARSALVTARASVQAILHETQRTLGILRLGPDVETRQPVPELARIADLVESFRSAGLTIDAQLAVVEDPVDPEVSAAAYRIVQESLTNAHRHGDGAARLRTTADGGKLVITIENRRPTPTAVRSDDTETSRQGFGLIGLRERVQSARGTVDIDDTPTDFAVRVTMRLDGKDVR